MNKRCNRCEHEWVARAAQPKVCPRCKSPYWDKPRVRSASPYRGQPRVRGLTPAKEVEDTVEELWNEYAVPSQAKEPESLERILWNEYAVPSRPAAPVPGRPTSHPVGIERDFDWGP